jgi:hypothetical protein
VPSAPPGLLWEEVRTVLDEEVQQLAEPFRSAFVLCVLEGKSSSEAAAELGCKEGTAKSRLSRARRWLQQRLRRRGIDLGAFLAALSVAESAGRAALPAALAHAAVRFGLLAAAGTPAAGVIPAPVAALAAGAGRALFVSKTAMAALVLLAAGLFVAGAGVLRHPTVAAQEGREAPAAPAAKAPARPAAAEAKPPAEDDKEAVAIAGRVLDPDGKPLAGARVYQTFWAESIAAYPPAPKVRATCDRDGRFRFTIPRDDWTREFHAVPQVVAVADGFGPDWVRLEQPEDRKLTLRLVKDDVPVTGRILDLEGRPIRGATIRPMAVWTTPEEDLTPWFQAIEDKRRIPYREPLSKQLGGLPHGIPGLPPTITTGEDGRFRLTGVGRERFVGAWIGGPKVRAGRLWFVTRAVPKFQVFINPDLDYKHVVYGASFEHIAAPAKPMIGTVRDKDTGKPLEGVKIDVRWPALPAITDREGKYRIESLFYIDDSDPEGIPVFAIPPADQPYLVGFKEVRPAVGLEGLTVDFSLKRGVWVQGKVTDKVTGKPVRANITYQPADDNPHRRDAVDFTKYGYLREHRSGPDGTFRVPALPGPGVITADELFFEQEHLEAGSARINPKKDAESVPCDVVLDPGRTLTGTILDPEGKPLAGVHAFNANRPDGWTSQPLPTASFRLIAVNPKGRRTLIFLHRDKRLVKALDLPGNSRDPLTVQLEPAGTLVGRLVDEDGQPRPEVGLGIYFRRQDVDYLATHLPVEIRTDREGRFRVEGLAPGVAYEIRVFGKPGTTIARRLSIDSGQTRDLGDVMGKLLPP